MSNGPKPRNVVDIAPEMMGRLAGRVLPQLRAIAGKRLAGLSAGLFDGVDDALFDMAERSGTNAVQARYFDGMREIRRKRQRGEIAWQEAFSRQFAEFEAGRLAPAADEGGGQRGNDGEPLGLVGEAELEETLAINAMVDKADVRLMRPLYALSQRLGLLAGGRKVDAANNPLGPRLLCQAFGRALAEFDVDLQVKLIVLKLFERFVLANLDALYEEANALLVQAGVMPELRYAVASARRPEGVRAAPPPAAPAEPPPDSYAGGDDYGAAARTDSEILELVHELRGLIAARRRSLGVPAAGGYPAGAVRAGGSAASAQELLNALTLMQSELQAQQFASGPVAPAPAPAQVKQELLAQIRRLGGAVGYPPQLGADEDTIDLVGMLFDYALQDRNLPAPIQALLGRLQIPYLKVALMDREFIAHKSHPARRLLDDLAQACVGWSEESDKDRRLYQKVHEIVVRLLKEFDDDLGIFERLHADFRDFVEKNRRRAEIAERRTTEAAQGRERLEQAQRAAARAILTRIQGAALPDSVRELLTRRWSNYLVLTFLRHGEDSSEWRAAVRFIEDLAWSVQPLRDDADRMRLRELTPEIEQLLRRGLQATGLHESFLDEIWRDVQRIYAHQFDPRQPAPAPAPATNDLSIRFASSRAGEEVVFQSGAEAQETDVDRAAAEALDTWLKIARALKTGTWFEFIKDDGSRERAKLLWISTIRALYLFVNRNGLKIAEKTAVELADELKSQRAVILEQVALVDRALDAILNRLRDGASESRSATTAGASAPGAGPGAGEGAKAGAGAAPATATAAGTPAPAKAPDAARAPQAPLPKH